MLKHQQRTTKLLSIVIVKIKQTFVLRSPLPGQQQQSDNGCRIEVPNAAPEGYPLAWERGTYKGHCFFLNLQRTQSCLVKKATTDIFCLTHNGQTNVQNTNNGQQNYCPL